MRSDHAEQPEKPASTERPKLPYDTPRLSVHGTVEEITQLGGAAGKDALSGSSIL